MHQLFSDIPIIQQMAFKKVPGQILGIQHADCVALRGSVKEEIQQRCFAISVQSIQSYRRSFSKNFSKVPRDHVTFWIYAKMSARIECFKSMKFLSLIALKTNKNYMITFRSSVEGNFVTKYIMMVMNNNLIMVTHMKKGFLVSSRLESSLNLN